MEYSPIGSEFSPGSEMLMAATDPVTSIIVGVLVLGSMSLFWYFDDKAKRRNLRSAKQAITQDQRSPVLYLRSFDDEYVVSIEEEILAKIMDEVGPFVAIGQPGEKLPPLGAARDYVSDDTWQSHIQSMLSKSQLVLLVAGDSEGLIWEVQQCTARLRPDQLVILVSDDRSVYQRFRKLVHSSEANLRLPDYPAKSALSHKAGQYAGMLRFDNNWQGRFDGFSSAAWVGTSHELASRETSLEDRLRLAFGQLNLEPGSRIATPRTNWLRIGFVSFLALAGIIFVMMAGLLATGTIE